MSRAEMWAWWRLLVDLSLLVFLGVSAYRGDTSWTVCFGTLLIVRAIEKKRSES